MIFVADEKYPDDELLLNARKPEGDLGNDLIDDMNVNHQGLVKWSLKHLDISEGDVILDVGCGGGVNVEMFLKMARKVYGIDYSELSVERSSELNRSAIDDGRCKIINASVSDMPFEDSSFDIVTAFETVYFWPDFINDLMEVRRVLKDGGTFFIANEALPNEYDERQRHIIDLLDMKIYSRDELEASLKKAGFRKIKSFTKKSTDSFTGDDAEWICVNVKR